MNIRSFSLRTFQRGTLHNLLLITKYTCIAICQTRLLILKWERDEKTREKCRWWYMHCYNNSFVISTWVHVCIFIHIFRMALFEELMTVAELISVEFVEGASVGVSCCLEGRCSISDFRNDRTNSNTAS